MLLFHVIFHICERVSFEPKKMTLKLPFQMKQIIAEKIVCRERNRPPNVYVEKYVCRITRATEKQKNRHFLLDYIFRSPDHATVII